MSAESDSRARGAVYWHSVGVAVGSRGLCSSGMAWTQLCIHIAHGSLGGAPVCHTWGGALSRTSWGQVHARAVALRCPWLSLALHREVCTAECDVPSDPESVQEPPTLTNLSGCVCGSETARSLENARGQRVQSQASHRPCPRQGPRRDCVGPAGVPLWYYEASLADTRRGPLHGLGASSLLHFTPQGPQEG